MDRADVSRELDLGNVPIQEMSIGGMDYILQHTTLPYEQIVALFLDIPDALIPERIADRTNPVDLARRLARAPLERE